ncbi:transglycosylase SLT domain-containing protein [Legionella dresdenensis]|uniref:Transglycosylase SLT domain-containing protein n=1 Tax=Legionella dresdenensis TaxID=450200 RepID=A0ABV8CCI9_9GAMM
MKKLVCFYLAASLFALPSWSGDISGQAYTERFNNYLKWRQNLPAQPDSEFLAFISDDTPLAVKLRERWLYQLARQKNWGEFSKYYKPTDDIGLQCFAGLADYYQDRQAQAFEIAKPLWLSAESRPQACNQLFDLMLKSDNFDEKLLSQRINLALEKRNLALARYLLKQYRQPRHKDEQLLVTIHQNPARITQVTSGDLHDEFYLYGLKRMVAINMDKAIQYSRNDQAKKLLSPAQKQAFLAHVALYKAMRNHDDASDWFSKVQSSYYTDILLDWQIRYALKRLQWKEVKKLASYQDPESPCWQYWLARAEEATGDSAKAKEIYQKLAETRNYYGFLASLHLNKKPAFCNENPIKNMALLKPYQPVIDNIKSLYFSKQTVEASRMLNDFVSELPKEDKSAVIYWVSNELQWHGKAIYLSSNEQLNNQLALRFPLAHHETVSAYAKSYQLPAEFIYAIIRQESTFRDDVVSSAGARGLMQIMPQTASQVAKREKIAYTDKAQLFSTQKNINIGAAYLKHLAKRFRYHPILVAAAYNAGPRQVNYWLKNHPPKQIDIWIETLPWQETRNYLKNVLAFYAVYQYRMQQKPDLKIFMEPL